MDYFWKTIGLILIGMILWVMVDRQEKDYGILLTLAVCCAAVMAAAAYLQPVLALVHRLEEMSMAGQGIPDALLKAVGVGFAAEITAMVCRDAGNSSMAGVAQFLGTSGILYLSIPLLQTLMNLVQEILGVI